MNEKMKIYIKNKMSGIKRIQEDRIRNGMSMQTNSIFTLTYGECLELLRAEGENISELEFEDIQKYLHD